MKILVTGGCGFIGSAVCRHMVHDLDHTIVNIDKLTYAATLGSTADLSNTDRYKHYADDICNTRRMAEIFQLEQPEAIVHLAAESHVDRSIDDASVFIQTNVMGTHSLLSAALAYYKSLSSEARHRFRFHHVSTDEVYGDLPFDDSKFVETTPYSPRSPYSASKAASDHLVHAWHHTYGLPTLITNCSNNYGPYHFPEKLIPLMILNALESRPLPVYGDGKNVRDWLFVEDHARAIASVLSKGKMGETYNIGGNSEQTNLQVVHAIVDTIDKRLPLTNGKSRRDLIAYVTDRPGHDRRYAIDCSKITNEIGWRAKETFESGMAKTIDWYLANEVWWRPLRQGVYAGDRLGKTSK
jgi:dTDP-glucose 4,6-dehydratase